MAIDLELNILTGCDGSGKSTVYDNIRKDSTINDNNILFRRFPTVDTRDVISMVSANEFVTDLYYNHKLFEVDFHHFFEEFNKPINTKRLNIDTQKPIRVLMDRFFPCNMAYALYHTDNDPSVLSTFDFIKHFINKEDDPNRRIKLHILHISPDLEKWIEYNGKEMHPSLLLSIEKCYQKVYNYLKENYSIVDLEAKGITSLQISKFYNHYDGNVEKDVRYCTKFPKI